MPFLAGLAPILTAVAAAGTLAATGYELANQPGSSSTSDAAQVKAQQDQAKAQQTAQQKVAFLAAQPNVQAQTGGSLSSLALNSAAATQAGIPSDLNSLAKYLGQTTGSNPAVASAPVSGGVGSPYTNNQGQPYDLQTLSDLLKAA